MSDQIEKIVHEAVKDHYGAIARSMDSSVPMASCCGSSGNACCGPSAAVGDLTAECGSSAELYDLKMLEGLPLDVTALSLGCGDPVTIAALQSGETVLDLGSGGGMDCFLAARRVGIMGKVIGVDMTPDMLAKANANKARLGVRNVEFRQGQIEALPVEDNSVDVVMSNCVINLAPDKRVVFEEAFRVLKPGGRIAVSDIVAEGEFTPELRAQVDKWAECVTGAIDVDVYTGLMRSAGFADIQVADKVTAEAMIEQRAGMPRLFSARVTARKA